MDGLLLSDLKVADLRKELERRKKDKCGVKQVLVDRLREALEENGHDPQTYRFGIDEDEQSPTISKEAMCPNGSVESGDTKDGIDQSDYPDDNSEPKKISEESVPYVVQVGDQEEDLDYDLKTDNLITQPAEKASVKEASTEQKSGDIIEKCEPVSPVVYHTESDSRRNVWVSNLPRTVKAADLKQHFSRAGKVLSATVAMSTKSPEGCFGFLQMNSTEDAENAVRTFDGTEYEGYKLTVEATDRKPPTLSYKPSDKSNTRPKLSSTQAAVRRRLPYLVRRRIYRGRSLNFFTQASLEAEKRARKRALERLIALRERQPARLNRIVRPRIDPNVVAYQSLRRASRLIAASRIGMMRRFQAMERSMSNSRVSRPIIPSRQPYRYSFEGPHPSSRYMPPERREPRRPIRPEPPVRRPSPPRRPEPRGAYSSERRRSMEMSLRAGRPPHIASNMPPPRRSEPLSRRGAPPRPSARPPPSPMTPPERRRWSQPSAYMRPADMSPRYDRNERPNRYSANDREFPRPPPMRRELEQRPMERRMDISRSPRTPQNEGRRMSPPQSSFNYARFKPVSSLSMPQRSPNRPQFPLDGPMPSHRDYRDMSRSPPRSRGPLMHRQFPEYPPPRSAGRERSPLRGTRPMEGRPKVVDYGHRSEQPRTSWPQYRNESPRMITPTGHTWKPAGPSMMSNYGDRNTERRYM